MSVTILRGTFQAMRQWTASIRVVGVHVDDKRSQTLTVPLAPL